MNEQLIKNYQTVFRQGFIPILVADQRSTAIEITACLKAGCRVIEFTQRRKDSSVAIPKLKQEHPELVVLAGSTMDSDVLVHGRRERFPNLRTLDELAILGADGFISMAGFQQETLIRFQNSKLLLPCAYTPNEAMEMLRLGAHFIKLIGPDTSLLRILTSPPLFHTIPCFVTGGMTLERIPETIQAGAVLIGTGFDLMLNGYDGDDPDEIAAVVRRYMQAVRDVRLSVNPALATLDTCDDAAIWRQLLEYHSPFAEALP